MDAIDSIGLPATVDEDGANGLKVNGGDSGGTLPIAPAVRVIPPAS